MGRRSGGPDVAQHLVAHVAAHALQVVVPRLVHRQAERRDALLAGLTLPGVWQWVELKALGTPRLPQAFHSIRKRFTVTPLPVRFKG